MDTWMLTRHVENDWGGNKHDRQEFYPPDEVTLQDLAGHIVHVCNLAVNAFHDAIGGDTDGQGAAEGAPFDVDTVADYQKAAEVLAERGWNDDDVENVMHRNWRRFFEVNLPAA